MKERFKEITLREDDAAMVKTCNAIIGEYQVQGLRMTLRQLFYQLVSRAIIENTEKSYKRTGDLLSRARLGGFVDWAAIEDRGRDPWTPADWPDGPAAVVERALQTYRRPRWEGQTRYVELWVEKQALAGVLEPLASEFHVTLMVNKGYSSQSAMYESSRRYIWNCAGLDRAECKACGGGGACAFCGGDGIGDGDGDGAPGCSSCRGSGKCAYCSAKGARRERFKEPWLFYIGDHDPSGEDMVRDIKDRMVMFGVDGIRVFKIALTMAQIEKYDPPPNPAKVEDPRAAKYIEKFGDSSWEVDALPPNVLTRIIRNAFNRVIDRPMMDAIITRENVDKEKLRKAVARIE